jgi:hypothetical protein
MLERFPITWNHVIEKESLNINELEHVLMRYRIYPISKYRKSRATFSGHALMNTGGGDSDAPQLTSCLAGRRGRGCQPAFLVNSNPAGFDRAII